MQNKLGGRVSGADGTYVLSRYNTRIPDVGYISEQRVQEQDEDSFLRGAPDLAIEVVSDSNTPKELRERVGAYLDAGSRLVWVVYPETRKVDVYRASGEQFTVEGNAELDGYEVL